MDALLTSEGLLALLTLTFLEIVLGVDNVIFISILSGKLPASTAGPRAAAGLLAAMAMRILLLLSIAWIIRLTAPLFSVFGRDISGRDLILIGGGLFLLGKATLEIHEQAGGRGGARLGARRRRRLPRSSSRSCCSTSSFRWIPSSPRSAWPTMSRS